MSDKYYDKTAERISKAGEFVADKQTAKELELVEKPMVEDKKINVLVMGISGAGKSTLINAVLGEEKAKVGDGMAVTQKMKVYEGDNVPFRMVDTVGLEYNYMRQQKILNELSKWSEDGLNRKSMAKLVHCIWFCIDAQSKRVSEESLDYLYKITRLWKGVPIIVVFTKSYSLMSIKDNEEMFRKVMSKYQKKRKLNVCDVISVLARELVIDENITLKNYGVDKLIDATSALMPRAKEINKEVMTDWSYRMRKNAAMKYIKAAKRSAFAITLMPKKNEDKQFIEPLWDNLISKIARAYVLSTENEALLKEKANKTISQLSFLMKLTKLSRVLNALTAYFITSSIGDTAVRTAAKLHKASKKAEKKEQD